MKPDRVTKFLLSVIALCVSVIALNGAGVTVSPAVAQRSPVVTDHKFPTVQISGDQNGFYLFDSATGRIWYYAAADFRAHPTEVGQLEEPGRRLGR